MFRICEWFKRVILRQNTKACNKRHPHYKRTKCQRAKDHSGQHAAKKPHGLTHYLYFAWYDDEQYSDPIFKRRG